MSHRGWVEIYNAAPRVISQAWHEGTRNMLRDSQTPEVNKLQFHGCCEHMSFLSLSSQRGRVCHETVGGAFVRPFVPRCMRVARACAWATRRRGGKLLRVVVVAMVVAEDVCKSWICLEVVCCETCGSCAGSTDRTPLCGAKGPRKELLSPRFFPPRSGEGARKR